MDFRNLVKKVRCFFHGHLQYITDGFPFIANLKGFSVKSLSLAGFTFYMDIRKEIHFDHFYSCSPAGFATPSFYIKTKSPGLITSDLSFGSLCKKSSDLVKNF